jgi:hypothetical protein
LTEALLLPVKDLVRRFRKRLATTNGNGTHPKEPAINLACEVAVVQEVESEQDIGLGRPIHRFSYEGLELRLDRDMTGRYRVTVNEGRERRYSFTLHSAPHDYEALHAGYEEIIQFLDGPRRITTLPDHERLKGHFYGAYE